MRSSRGLCMGGWKMEGMGKVYRHRVTLKVENTSFVSNVSVCCLNSSIMISPSRAGSSF